MGENITLLDTTRIDATGATGGGTILVGGSWQNSDTGVPQATFTTIGRGVVLDASATENGNGGTIVAWSDVHNPLSFTRAYGTFLARGGVHGGDGGRIETSGHRLDVAGVQGNAAAPSGSGKGGLWLFDPYNVAIAGAASSAGAFDAGTPDTWTPSATASTILDTDIESRLNAGTSVTVTTTNGAGAQNGSILVNAPIDVTGATPGTFTLQADRNIYVNANITSTNGPLHLVFVANKSNDRGSVAIFKSATVSTKGGNVWIGGGSGTATWNTLTVGDGGGVGNNWEDFFTGIPNSGPVDNRRGVTVSGMLNAEGGDIYIHGQDGNVAGARGVGIGGTVTTSGGGSIQIIGAASGTSSGIAIGDTTYYDAGTNTNKSLTLNGSVSAGTGGITLTGTVGGGTTNGGIQLVHAASALATTGNLALTSTGKVFGDGSFSVTGTTSITATTYDITLTNTSNDFTGAVSVVSAANVDIQSATNLTLGATAITGNLTAEALAGDLTVAGNISKSSGADATATLKATGNIIQNAGTSVSSLSNKLHTILWADSDGASGGGIHVQSGASISSNGGNVVLAGGADGNTDGIPDGYAKGTDAIVRAPFGVSNLTYGTRAGILLEGSIASSNGNVLLRGEAAAGVSVDNAAVYIAQTGSISSAAGNIDLIGRILADATAGNIRAVRLGDGVESTQRASASATTGAITMDGDASAGTTGGSGILFDLALVQTTTGSIALTGKRKSEFDIFAVNSTSSLRNALSSTSGSITLNADTLSLDTESRLTSAGQLIIQPRTASTTIGIAGGPGTLQLPASYFSTNFTDGFSGITIGNATVGDMTVGASALTYNDPLTLKTAGNLNFAQGASLTSGTGANSLVLWANADGETTNGGSIALLNGSSITTNGGHVWMGGGSVSGVPWNGLTVGDGYALGNASNSIAPVGDALRPWNIESGIFLGHNVTLNTGGGNVALYGKGRVAPADGPIYAGVAMDTLSDVGTTVNSGTGTMVIDGVGQGGGDSNVQAVMLLKGATITSANTTSSAVTVTGDASLVSGSNAAIGINLYPNATIQATGSGGGVTLTGTGGTVSSGNGWGLYMGGSNILANGGPISLTGAAGAGSNDMHGWSSATIGYKAGSDVTSSSSNITINVDKLSTIDPNSRIQSSGALTIAPRTAGTTIGIAGGAGTLEVPASYFSDNFSNGFSGITIGNATASNITVGNIAISYSDPLTLKTATNIAINSGAAMTGNNSDLILNADADSNGGVITVAAGSTISSGGGAIVMGGGVCTVSGCDGPALATGAAGDPGVDITGSAINSGNGLIWMRGTSTSNGGPGILIKTNSSIDSGSGGSVWMRGDGWYVAPANGHGIALYDKSTIRGGSGGIQLFGNANVNSNPNSQYSFALTLGAASTSDTATDTYIYTTHGGTLALNLNTTEGNGNESNWYFGEAPGALGHSTLQNGNISITFSGTETLVPALPNIFIPTGNLSVTSHQGISQVSSCPWGCGNIDWTRTQTIAGSTTINGGGYDVNLGSNGGALFTTSNLTVSNASNVSVLNQGAMTLGAVSASGAVDIATLTGNLTLTGIINAGTNAITLNAGKNETAGTTTGGDIIVSGGALTGSTGLVRLFSGSAANSTSLSVLATTGTYTNADETSTLSPALGASGIYAIYRELPGFTISGSTGLGAGQTIRLYRDGGNTNTVLTDGSGNYSFTGLGSTGNYLIFYDPGIGSTYSGYAANIASFANTTLNLQSNVLWADTSMASMRTALGGVTDYSAPYTYNVNAITVKSGVAFKTNGAFSIDGNITTQNASQTYGGAVTVNTAATLMAQNSGNITFSGLVTAPGIALDLQAPGGAITASDTGNNFGTVTLNALGNVSIIDTNSLTLGASTVGGNLAAEARGGDLTISAPITWSANNISLTASNDIKVDDSLNATGTGTLAFAYGQGSANGGINTYAVAATKEINIPNAAAFTWKKGSGGLVKNLVLDNGILRFGNGTQASIGSDGQLLQPWYFDNTSVVGGVTRNGWFKLTIGANPLDLEIGAGGDGTSSWNRNGSILNTQTGTLLTAVSGRSLEISKYKEGVGSITASTHLGFVTGENLKVSNTYTLSTGASFLKTDTVVTNLGADVSNVRLWVGTRDDWIADADSSIKTKGNLTAGGFQALTTQNTQAQALKINELNTGEGAVVLFFSTSGGADTTLASCCSFSNSTSIDPRTSPITAGPMDGSYSLFMRLPNLIANQSSGMTWYYAAGSVANLSAVTSQVATDVAATAIPITVSTSPLSVSYGTTPAYTYDLVSGTLTFGDSLNTVLSGNPACIGCITPGSYSVISGSVSAKTGYNLTWQNGTLNITKALLSVNALPATKIYNGLPYVGGNGVTYSGFVYGENSSALGGTLGYTGTSQNAINVGTYGLTPTGLSSSNYDIAYGSSTLTVDKAPLSITASNISKTYGTTQTFAGTEFTSSGLQNSETIGSVTLTSAGTPAVATVAGGLYAIVPSSATGGTFSSGNYNITYTNGTLTVNPAPLTITASDASKAYGATKTFAGTEFTSSGLQNSDAISSVTLTSTGAAATASVGSSPYAITPSNPSGASFSSSNYNITYTNGGLTVNPAPLTITASNTSKTYGATKTFAGTEFTSSGLQNSETIGAVTLSSTGTPATATVAGGPYAIVPGSATGGTFSSGNYTISYANGSLTVNPAPLTITASNTSKTYGATKTFAGTEFTSSGLQNSETIGAVTLSSTGSATTASVAGSPYSIVPGAAIGGTFNASNYNISYTNGALTVNKAPLTITADNVNKTYGDTYAFSGTEFISSGLLNNETIGSVTLTSTGATAIATVAGGPYPIIPGNATGGSFSASNYTVSYANGQMTVTPANLTVTANVTGNPTKVYDATNVATLTSANYSLNGFVNGDSASVTKTTGTYDSVNAGARTVKVNLASSDFAPAGSTVLSNYKLPTTATGLGTITPKAITLTAPAVGKVYDASLNYSATASDLVTFNSVLLGADSISAASMAFADKNAGSGNKTVNLNSVILNDGNGGNNYTVTLVGNSTSTITPAPLTITASNVNKTFGQVHTFAGTEFTSIGLKGNDTIGTVTLTSTGSVATASVAGGPYPIIPSNATGGTFSASNYSVSYVNGQLAITPANLTVTASVTGNPTKVYDATTVATLTSANYSLSGFVNGDSATVTKTTGTYDSANAGARTVTVNLANSDFTPAGSTALSNYKLPTTATGSGTITPAPLTITASNVNKTFGQVHTFAGTEFTSSGLKGNDTIGAVTLTSTGSIATASVAGGPYPIIPSNATGGTFSASNYNVSYVNGQLAITPANLTVTASVTGNPTKVYDATTVATLTSANYSLSGFVNGDSATVTKATGTYDSANAGTRTVTVNLASSDFSAAGSTVLSNYKLPTTATGLGTITPAPLTITASNVNKTFGQVHTFAGTEFTSSGLKGSDTIGRVTLTSTGSAATATVAGGPYPIIPSNAIGGTFSASNYNVSYVNGQLAITPANLTVTASVSGNPTKVYDATNIATLTSANYSLSGFVNGDSATVIKTTGTYDSANAGTRTVTVNLASSDFSASGSTVLSNYKLPTTASGSGTITPAPLTITASNISKTFGEVKTFSGTEFTSSGLKGNDTIGTVTLTSTGSSATAAVAGGPYPIIPSNATGGSFNASNYSVSYVNGQLAITPANLTVTASVSGNPTKVYDATNIATLTSANYSLSGFVNGDGAAVTKTTGTYDSANAGGRTVTVNLASSDFSAAGSTVLSNYKLPTTASGSGTITPAPLTITASNASKTFGEVKTFSGTEFTSSGLKGNDTIGTVTLSSTGSSATATVAGGPYPIIPSNATGGTFSASNYKVSYVNGQLAITPANLTVTASVSGNPTKVYDATNIATLTSANYSLSGFVNGDGAAVTKTTGTYDSANAGTRTVTVNLASSDFSATGSTVLSNYKLPTTASGLGSITPAPLTITASNASKTFGEVKTFSGTEFTSSGLKGNDTIGTVTLTSTGSIATATVAGGPYPIIPSNATGGNFNAPNYSVSYVNGQLAITPANLTVTASVSGNPTKVYDATNIATLTSANYSLSGFVNGDGAAVTKTTGTYDSANAGARTVTVNLSNSDFTPTGSTALSNYKLPTTATGSGTITPAPLTITASNASKKFGEVKTFSGTEFTFSGLKGSDTVGTVTLTSTGFSATASVAGGPYPIIPGNVTGGSFNASNYSVSYVNGQLVITPANLTVTASVTGNPTKVYDATNVATLTSANYSLGGFVNGDSATVTKTTGTYDSANVGTRTVTVSLAGSDFSAAGRTDLSNYKLPSTATGSGTIRQAPLTITADSLNKTFGEVKDFTGSEFKASGLKGNDSVGSITLTSAGSAATASVAGGPYAIVPSNATGGSFSASNYTISYANGQLTVKPAIVTVSASITGNPSKVYDATTVATLTSANYGLSGFANGDGAAVTKTTGTYDSANAGSRTVTVNLAAGDFSATGNTDMTNYKLPTTATGPGTITPKAVTLTAPPVSKVYDAALSYSATGAELAAFKGALLGSDSVSAATLAFADKNAGSGNKTVSLSDVTISDGNGGKNYAITLAGNSTSSITPAPLTITASSASKVYGSVKIFTGAEFTSSGLKGSDTVGNVTLTSNGAEASATVAGGPYAIAVSNASGGSFNPGNYTVAYVNGQLTVTPAPLTVSANNDSRVASDKAYSGGKGVAFSGFVNNESASALGGTLGYGGSSQGAVSAGSYAITPAGYTSSNYTIRFVDGTLTLTEAPPTIPTTSAPTPAPTVNNTPATTATTGSGGTTPGAVGSSTNTTTNISNTVAGTNANTSTPGTTATSTANAGTADTGGNSSSSSSAGGVTTSTTSTTNGTTAGANSDTSTLGTTPMATPTADAGTTDTGGNASTSSTATGANSDTSTPGTTPIANAGADPSSIGGSSSSAGGAANTTSAATGTSSNTRTTGSAASSTSSTAVSGVGAATSTATRATTTGATATVAAAGKTVNNQAATTSGGAGSTTTATTAAGTTGGSTPAASSSPSSSTAPEAAATNSVTDPSANSAAVAGGIGEAGAVTMTIPETSQPMAPPAAFAEMLAPAVVQVAVSSIQSQAANGGASTTTALSTLSDAQVTAAVARGMPQEQAQQAGAAFTQALVQHISNGMPMGEAVALAQKTFQIEASFPLPKSPQEAVVKNIASSDMAQNVNAKLAALAGAKTSEGTQAFEKALAVAMLKGGDFSDAVKAAQNAVQQAETLARADSTPQASLANGNARTDVFAKTSPGYQRALGSLLAKGYSLEQAMDRAARAAADADAAAKVDANNPLAGLSSGDFSILDKYPLEGAFGKTLGVLMNRGVNAAQAMEIAIRMDAQEQQAIQVDARSELVGFSKGGGNALPQGDAHFDRALAQAVNRGESPTNAIRIARKAVEKLPTEVQTPATALASGKNVDTLLSSPGNSRIFKQALGNALARGVPVEEAIALARRAEAANAFRYPLPQSLAKLLASSGSKVEVTTDAGKPLPSWLRFDISSRAFVAAEVPSGALPLRAVVALSGQRFTLDVSEGAMPK